jgi:hypothetical protein
MNALKVPHGKAHVISIIVAIKDVMYWPIVVVVLVVIEMLLRVLTITLSVIIPVVLPRLQALPQIPAVYQDPVIRPGVVLLSVIKRVGTMDAAHVVVAPRIVLFLPLPQP